MQSICADSSVEVLVKKFKIHSAVFAACFTLTSVAAHAQTATAPKPGASTQKPFEPQSGQAGKDVVWVPTPQALVDKMLDMAKAKPGDFLMDLGSGDGRTVISAAKRGLTAQGIEYNPDMVELSKKNAQAAGVSGKAAFEKADLFETDFSKADVITLFLLPALNLKLRPKILDLKPGTRIVSNTFNMDDWQPDETAQVTEGCSSYCTAFLWIVPAKVGGTWTTPQGELTLTQQFQMLTGTLASTAISEGKVNGDEVTFTVGDAKYTGKLSGNTIQGTITGGAGGSWTATKKM